MKNIFFFFSETKKNGVYQDANGELFWADSPKESHIAASCNVCGDRHWPASDAKVGDHVSDCHCGRGSAYAEMAVDEWNYVPLTKEELAIELRGMVAATLEMKEEMAAKPSPKNRFWRFSK